MKKICDGVQDCEDLSDETLLCTGKYCDTPLWNFNNIEYQNYCSNQILEIIVLIWLRFMPIEYVSMLERKMHFLTFNMWWWRQLWWWKRWGSVRMQFRFSICKFNVSLCKLEKGYNKVAIPVMKVFKRFVLVLMKKLNWIL